MHNSQKLSLTNIYVLHSNFVRCESFFESNSPDILALDEIHLDGSFKSSNSSVRSHLSLIRKGSVILIHGLAVYLKDVLSFAQDLSLERFLVLVPWCSGYHYFTTLFKKAWTQVLHRFKPCSRRVGDSRWWGSLIMVVARIKAKRLSSVNHTTKTIHHH